MQVRVWGRVCGIHVPVSVSVYVGLTRQVALYLDYTADESYTPKKFSIHCGYSHHDLREFTSMEVDEPKGWIRVPLKDADSKVQ